MFSTSTATQNCSSLQSLPSLQSMPSMLQQIGSHHMSDCALNAMNGSSAAAATATATTWPFLPPADPFGMKLQHYLNSDYLVMTALPPNDHLSHHLSSTTSTSGLAQKDTTFTKIFVGGLPYHTTDKSLRQFFETFGEIEEAVVITDRQTGKSRGYGFVTMADRDSAERAVKEANPIIDGRKANVNLAYLGAKPRNNIQNGFTFPIRAGYPTVLPASQFGLPPHHYVYHHPAAAAASAYLPAAPSLLLPPAAALSPTHFYDYPSAPAYPPPYTTATNGFDSPYASFHPSHQTGAIGPAAVAAAVAAASSVGANSNNPNGHSANTTNVHPFTAYGTTNGTVSTTAANYLATVTPTTTVSYISAADARMQ